MKLESNGKQIELQIGMQMKKPEQGDWAVASGAEMIDLNASTSTGETNGTDNAQASSAGSAGGGSDILKRLLQKREQELGTQKSEQKNPGEDGPNEKR